MKKLINTTGSNIPFPNVGFVVPANSYYVIQEHDYALVAHYYADFHSYIVAGSIVVNDGTVNLGATDGENFLKHPDFATNVRIDATSARNSALGQTMQEFLDRFAGPNISQKPTYDSNYMLQYTEFFKGPTQTTQYRTAKAALTYDANLDPVTETWYFYMSDGTTVEKTVTFTYTFVGAELTKTEMVTS